MSNNYANVSDKGGVGKSKLTGVLVDIFKERAKLDGDKVNVYDLDVMNRSLSSCYPSARLIDIFSDDITERQKFGDAIMVESKYNVFDFPAGGFDKLSTIMNSADELMDVINNDLQGSLTLICLITSNIETVVSLDKAISEYGNSVKYWVVVNEGLGGAVELLAKSKNLQSVIDVKYIVMPKINPALLEEIKQLKVSYHDYCNSGSVNFKTIVVKKWIDGMRKQINGILDCEV